MAYVALAGYFAHRILKLRGQPADAEADQVPAESGTRGTETR